ncbi:three-Cys-motif partner protein TcmP [Candidatus Poriferisocius sp.]|uniref:three-Cys-motif partner protein TcmP n=1 Tax=Candidatus Poriferisocius sp. TaxID=3101276 RepID=UPI003B02E843
MREWSGHSYEKISILGDYLPAFAQATQRAPNRVYVDAFAGDSQNFIKGTDREFPGSPELALGVSPPFTHLRFFEKSPSRAQRLRGLAIGCGNSGVQVVEGDCNEEMAGVLRGLPVQAPAFAFLDPDGMELRWKTIQAIADHKRVYAERTGRSKVEMWILFCTFGIVRMLGSNRDEAVRRGFPQRVAELYGAWGPWQEIWDARLDGRITPGNAKKAYLYLYMDRLADLGYQHLLVRPIKPTRGNELYAMIFVTDSPAGESIMRWSQERDRIQPREGTLFDVEESRPRYEDLHTGWRDELPFELPEWEDVV